MAVPAVVPFPGRTSRRHVVAGRLARVARRSPAAAAAAWASMLRDALDDLGPVFSSFGDYLGTRVDMLPVAQCRELARCRPTRRPALRADIDRIVRAELGASCGITELGDLIAVGATSQTHTASLANGARIHVDVTTLDADDAATELELLPHLREACAGHIGDAVLGSAIADFRQRFHESFDGRQRLAIAIEASRVGDRDGRFVAPVPRPTLCTRRVFAYDPALDFGAFPDRGSGAVPRGADLAVRVVSAWLHQALSGSVFPVVAGDCVLTPDGRIVAAGRFARIPDSASLRMTDYLLAVAADAPDRAWTALAPELTAIEGAAPAEDVLRAFRCLVPFRDDQSCDSGSDTADYAFLQWRTATKNGWCPGPHLVAFYQGLFGIVSAVRDATGGRDILAEAACDFRFDAAARHADEWARTIDVMAAMERHMALLLQLPQKVDRLLTAAGDGTMKVHLVPANDSGAARRSAAALSLAVVLLVAAIGVLAAPWAAPSHAVIRSFGLFISGAALAWAIGRAL